MSGQSHFAPKAMILAAGKGTRLQPLTNRVPKAMVSVGGRPLLEHTVELLREHGVRDIAINLHAHADAIAEHLGDGSRFGVRLTYSFEPRLLGTAGAVKKLEEFFKDGTFYVVYGDVLTRLDLSLLMDYHRGRGAMATVALYRPEDPTRCGVVQQDENDWITSFTEKPEGGTTADVWANAAIYVIEPSLLHRVREDIPQDFGRDIFPEIVKDGGRLAGFRSRAVFWDVGTVERLRQAEDWFLTVAGKEPHSTRIGDIAGKYLSSVQRALSAVDLHNVTRAAELILDARASGSQVLILGNGGSSATASHMAFDLTRAAADSLGPPLRCRSLTDNVPAVTAWSDDIGSESALALQVEQLVEPGDVLIAISASGQSRNIIAAAEAARRQGSSVIGLVGLGGGELAGVCDAAVAVASNECAPVEDIHLFLSHLLSAVVRWEAESAEDVELANQAERRLEAVSVAASGAGTD